MLGYISPITTFLLPHLEKKFLCQHTKLKYFRQICHNRDLCRSLQPGLISFTKFDEKLDLPIANHERIYKLIMNFDWKQLFRKIIKLCNKEISVNPSI